MTCVNVGCVNVKYAKPRERKSPSSRQTRNRVFLKLFLPVGQTPQQMSSRMHLNPTSSSVYKQRGVHTGFVTQSSFPTFPTVVIENRFSGELCQCTEQEHKNLCFLLEGALRGLMALVMVPVITWGRGAADRKYSFAAATSQARE